jgi:predicted TIM-barrel fold metal-dependent hydrolase
MDISRRQCITAALLASPAWSLRGWGKGLLSSGQSSGSPLAIRPRGELIETHVHLFSADATRFPLNPLSYKPKPLPIEEYVRFAVAAKIDHAVAVQPEPYQDDHRYLEYCFVHEPFKGFFKGTCLFDPIAPKTPERMRDLMRRNPNRIVALRIHELYPAGTSPARTGAIRDRDLKDPQMLVTWRAARELGLIMQIQSTPRFAVPIRELAKKVPGMAIILDHLDRPGQGTSEEYDQVLALAELPQVYMKFTRTGVQSASTQPFPHLDAKPLVKRVYEGFGPERILWGEIGANWGANTVEFGRCIQLFDMMFDFVPESEKARMRGLNAKKLFAFA